MAQHTIVLEKFQGPLDVLLQFIEEKKLEITDIALSEVTEQYLAYLEQVEEMFPEELADFLVIAAKLLFLKSKILLPVHEEEVDEEDLAQQLRLFHRFQEASKDIEKLLHAHQVLFAAQEGVARQQHITFVPPEGITGTIIAALFQEILERLRPAIVIPESSIQRAVSMKEKILQIYRMLSQKNILSFRECLEIGSRSKSEIIVTFLALLELAKQQRIHVRQTKVFTDITIENISISHESLSS